MRKDGKTESLIQAMKTPDVKNSLPELPGKRHVFATLTIRKSAVCRTGK